MLSSIYIQFSGRSIRRQTNFLSTFLKSLAGKYSEQQLTTTILLNSFSERFRKIPSLKRCTFYKYFNTVLLFSTVQ